VLILGSANFSLVTVQRPARLERIGKGGGDGEARRAGEAVAGAAFALAGNDGVDSKGDGVELCRLAAFDHAAVEPLVLVDKLVTSWGGKLNRPILDADRGETGNAAPQAELLRRADHGAFALPVEHALQRGGGQHQRQRAFAARMAQEVSIVSTPASTLGTRLALP